MGYTSSGLHHSGKTKHYEFQYDKSYEKGAEPARTNDGIANCESDFDQLQQWFIDESVDNLFPIKIRIVRAKSKHPGPLGARWFTGRTIWINPGSAGDANLIRYMLVAEMVEIFT